MSEQQYDVIIVGSGSSGGTLAARLAERSGRSVLVLEAGPVYRSASEMPAPLLDPSDTSNARPGAENNWNLIGSLTDQVQRPVARGKGLGGSSSINGTYFIRATPANHAEWARRGNDEWSYERVLPFYKRLESERDFPNDDAHGKTGPIPVTREPSDRAPEFTEAFTKACLDLGFPFEGDKNSSGTGGVGPVPLNVAGGRRVGTALGYLIPAMARPNLTVVGDALVHRALFDGSRCVGVQATVRGQLTEFRGSEIVFSAGALRTPQLLMLSGIGPASHLREWGIEVRMDLPGVGANLTDHPELSVPWTFRGRHPAMPGRGMLTSALHWTADGSDKPGDLEILPFVATTAQMMRIANMMRNPLNTAKMIRNTSLSLVLSQARTMRLPFIVIGLQQPNSRGSVKLAAADPTVAPQLHWNVFAEEADRRRFREAITVTSAIFEASSMRAIGASLKGLGPNDLRSNASLDVWMNEHIFTVGHASGTCRMGPSSDPDAVADQYGRVHGVENLRICDQSLFPEIPSRGPNATAIMLGERMAEFFERDAV